MRLGRYHSQPEPLLSTVNRIYEVMIEEREATPVELAFDLTLTIGDHIRMHAMGVKP
jgi:autotransporter translocation and assembly factor TamB